MLSKFFLDRPVFAWVIAIVIMLVGGLAIYTLPVSQYPPIAPPTIYIQASYPGASAETVENSVTQIIEQKMTGLDQMIYLSATSDSAGGARLELTFAPGTDPDLAWAKVQNKLQLAMASLPEVVQSQGITVGKATRNYLIIVGLISEDGSMDGNDLRDYAQSNLEKVLARVPGVGEVENFGSQYAMRLWLNPDRLTDYRLTIEDVLAALKAYNVEVSAGQFGGAPAVSGQRLNASIIVQSMLKTPEQFAAVPVRINPDGSVVHIKDVGRAELGTDAYDIEAFYNGRPAAGMAIRQAAGANALETADRVKAKMAEMSRYFPPGMKVVYPYDTTPFIKVAIGEVVKTLFEAILLVFLVMWLFMGNFRATLIPTIAVPVVLLGTFAVLGVLRLLHQHADHVRHGAGHRPSGGRRHRGGGKRGTDHERGRAFAEGSHAEIHGADHQRPDRHRGGARGGLRPHGLLRRLDRRDLSPVLRDHHLLHAPLGGGGLDPDAGPLRLAPQAGAGRARARGECDLVPAPVLRLVRSRLLPASRSVRRDRRTLLLQEAALRSRLCRDRVGGRVPLSPIRPRPICRTRIRGSCCPWSCCPPGPPWSRPSRS